MASTEALPLFARLAPRASSVQRILAWAQGVRAQEPTLPASLCRQDIAVLIAWVWREPGEPELAALPILSGSQHTRSRSTTKSAGEIQRWACRWITRWAVWQPDVYPDWTQPCLARCYETLQRAGLVARRLAEQLPANADEVEVAARLAGVGQVLHGCGLIRQATARRYWRLLARAPGWPSWLADLLAILDLPLPPDSRVPAPEIPGRIVQCAWQYAQTSLPPALRVPGPDWHEILTALGLPATALTDIHGGLAPPTTVNADFPSLVLPCPATQSYWPLLADLLGKLLQAQQQARRATLTTQRWQRYALTNQEQIEAALHQRKLQALAVFAAGAGHELGNPLAVISGYAEELLRGEKRAERVQALERILAQCQRIDALIRDLMFFARPPKPKRTRCRLDRLLAQSVAQLTPFATSRSVTIHCQSNAKLSVTADKAMLQKALACLLRNAVEAAPPGGWVRYSLSQHDSRLTVQIEDNGPGPDPAWQEHIFDPFFSGREAGRGRGFGLCTVWRIAQLHGGDITWQRTPHNTTIFTLRLPLHPGARKR
ncbi:Sporulation kinase D [bacterium HR36]|nr:Sporulation kinase D [bacterium HR36]